MMKEIDRELNRQPECQEVSAAKGGAQDSERAHGEPGSPLSCLEMASQRVEAGLRVRMSWS